MEGISKAFPGVQALKDVSLNVYAGEAMALLGENGAGKSTLMKVMTGIYTRDEGTITYGGREVAFRNSRDAAEQGISIIHQELNLIPHMKIYENIFLGREIKNGRGGLNKKAMIARTRELLDSINVSLDPEREIKGLSIAMQQMVEIAKALSLDARIIIMDEPTGALPDEEVDSLFRIVRDLKQKGKGIVYITHRLKEVFEICERATVFRDGQYIDEVPVSELDNEKLVSMMVGRKLTDQFPYVDPLDTDETILQVENLSNEYVKDISFVLKKGHILGVAGLAGAGRTELAKTIYGVYPHETGKIRLKGSDVEIRNPNDAIGKGIFYVSEDRKGDGVILGSDVKTNMTISSLSKFTSGTRINKKKENEVCEQYRKDLNVRTPSLRQLVRNLSGGNQQKVVLAKWLAAKCDYLIFDEPTTGLHFFDVEKLLKAFDALLDAGHSLVVVEHNPDVIRSADWIIDLGPDAGARGGEVVFEGTPEKMMAECDTFTAKYLRKQ